MRKSGNKRLTTVLMTVGIALMILSVAMVIVTEVAEKNFKKKAESIVSALSALMPDTVDCVPDDRVNTVMPTLEIEETDFVGLIELPDFDIILPICSEWNKTKISQFPCRYMGGVYEKNLIIGGNDNEGQFDFIKTISNGDTVSITDVEGQRFNFIVTDIRKTKDVSTENLTKKVADLVLFARNSFGFDYTVVRCDFKTAFDG